MLAAAMTGEIELAKASQQELRRAQPTISLAWIVEQISTPRNERHLDAFRRARELYAEAFSPRGT